MKLKITIPAYHFLVVDVQEDCGVLLKQLANAKLVTSSGYGSEQVFKEPDAGIHVTTEIVPNDFFVAPHDAIKKLTASLEDSSKRWLDTYNEKNKLDKELTSLKEKIAALGIEVK